MVTAPAPGHREPKTGNAPKEPWLLVSAADSHGRWPYAATQATRWTVWFAASAVSAAVLLAGGLVVELQAGTAE